MDTKTRNINFCLQAVLESKSMKMIVTELKALYDALLRDLAPSGASEILVREVVKLTTNKLNGVLNSLSEEDLELLSEHYRGPLMGILDRMQEAMLPAPSEQKHIENILEGLLNGTFVEEERH